MLPVRAVVTDIEGTTTPIAFVHEHLFPYARARMAAFLAARADDPEVRAALAETRRMVPDVEPAATLDRWMTEDSKATPLKTLQGLVWDVGYAAGELRGEVYPDVAPALRTWHGAGVRLAVYSSGSVAAQKLIFGHSTAGDLSGLFGAWFDTRVGAKREAASYDRIAIALGLPAADILFLSDVEAELDAASGAGLRVCQLARPADVTARSEVHPVAGDFAEVSRLHGLPGAG